MIGPIEVMFVTCTPITDMESFKVIARLSNKMIASNDLIGSEKQVRVHNNK